MSIFIMINNYEYLIIRLTKNQNNYNHTNNQVTI